MGTSTARTHHPRRSLDASTVRAWLSRGTVFSCQSGQVILGWGESRWENAPNSETSAWFYLPDYFLEKDKPWLNYTSSETLTTDELLSLLADLPEEETSPLQWSSPEKEPFEKGFEELQASFNKTSIEKVVLYTMSTCKQTLSISQRKMTLMSILKHAKTVPLFLYGFWDETEGLLGATPELLFRLDYMAVPPILKTMALAGTQKTDDRSSDMLDDKKLLKEHNIVVDDICHRLAELGSVTKEPLQLLTLPYLTHLYTPITLEVSLLEPFSSFVKKLHPTPALGGFPRDLAWQWLSHYNKILPRGRYGAPVGYWDPLTNDSACYVAIRNVVWNSKGSSIAAGCGIVAESDFDKEWDEVLLKTTSIKGFLQL